MNCKWVQQASPMAGCHREGAVVGQRRKNATSTRRSFVQCAEQRALCALVIGHGNNGFSLRVVRQMPAAAQAQKTSARSCVCLCAANSFAVSES